jgi:molybdopterin-biosynthesis enzyme MoeA-like protein
VPVTTARFYVELEEGELAPHLDAIVREFPAVRVGSYPRFSERDFKVLVTLESSDAAAVGGAFEALSRSLDGKVVRREEPAQILPST